MSQKYLQRRRGAMVRMGGWCSDSGRRCDNGGKSIVGGGRLEKTQVPQRTSDKVSIEYIM